MHFGASKRFLFVFCNRHSGELDSTKCVVIVRYEIVPRVHCHILTLQSLQSLMFDFSLFDAKITNYSTNLNVQDLKKFSVLVWMK